MPSSASWNALSATIHDIAGTMVISSDDDRLLQNLLLSLDVFAATWLESFVKSFQFGALASSSQEHPDYITSVIVDKASRDLDLIVTACLQRLSLTGSSGALAELQELIQKTDLMAQAALQPATAGKLLADPAKPGQETVVLTYFNQATHIRLFPYYPLVLVGVPYSAKEWRLDFCAIPHELGHVAFLKSEYARQAAGSVRQRVQTERAHRGGQHPTSTKWYDPWLEEIFADIYACTVAGPYAAYHMINLSKGWSSADLIATAGGYPPPLLRPYICIETLAQINCHVPGLELEGVIGRLRDEWSAFASRHSEVELADGAKTPLASAIDDIREAVHDILQPFLNDWNQLGSARYWPERSTWRLAVDGTMPLLVDEAVDARVTGATIAEKLTPDAARELIDIELNAFAANKNWRRLLDFGGWLDKGPEGGKPHRPT